MKGAFNMNNELFDNSSQKFGLQSSDSKMINKNNKISNISSPVIGQIRENGCHTVQNYIDIDLMSQNIHPNEAGRATVSSNFKEKPPHKKNVSFKNSSKDKSSQKKKSSKTSKIKMCSSKKSNSKERKIKGNAKSNNISSRQIPKRATLISSMGSLPKALNQHQCNTKSSAEGNKTVLSNYTNEILSKYENNKENVPILTDFDRKILTQKAIASARLASDDMIRQPRFTSIASDSFNDSARIVNSLHPYQKSFNPKSSKSDKSYINYVNEEDTFTKYDKDINPVSKIVIHEVSRDSSSTQRYKPSKSSKSRSKSLKKTKLRK